MKISDFFSELQKINHVYRDLILTSNFQQINDTEISWNNYSPGIYKSLYAREYEILVQNRQYSFLLNNKLGFLRFYFKCSELNATADKIKMCYYPYPVKLKDEREEVESYYYESDDELLQEYFFDLWNLLNQHFSLPVEDPRFQQIIALFRQEGREIGEDDLLYIFNKKYDITNSSHIRIDFDQQVESHHKCEIQIGAINSLRFPMDRAISPFVFFDFIIKNLDKKSYQEISRRSSFPPSFAISRKKSWKYNNRFTEGNIYITLDDF